MKHFRLYFLSEFLQYKSLHAPYITFFSKKIKLGNKVNINKILFNLNKIFLLKFNNKVNLRKIIV